METEESGAENNINQKWENKLLLQTSEYFQEISAPWR